MPGALGFIQIAKNKRITNTLTATQWLLNNAYYHSHKQNVYFLKLFSMVSFENDLIIQYGYTTIYVPSYYAI